MHCRARGKHAAPGHRVDMSSRLPPYFTQIKSNIPPPTAYAVGHGRHLCCTPHSDIILGRFLVQRLYALFVVLYCSDRVLLAGDERRYREATQATVPHSKSSGFALAVARKNV